MRLFPLSVVLLLAWGALAFGAEYTWAYAPLLVWATATGVLGWLASRGQPPPARALATALGAVWVAAALQLVPLPGRVVTSLSPGSTAADYQQLYAQATMRASEESGKEKQHDASEPRTLSIAPSRTMLGLAFLTAFTVLFLGCTRGLSGTGVRNIGRAIWILGVIVALAELAQKASGSDVVYGFWYPPKYGTGVAAQSAPFINRNHTAGWLIMALSLSVGAFAGSLARGLRGVRPDWRHRLLWFSTPQASDALLTGLAILVMAIAVVMTASRSGATCLAVAILIFGFWVARRQPSRSRKAIGATYLITVLLAAATLGGIEVVLQRFLQIEGEQVGRLHAWGDTLRIVSDFPWTGTGLNTYGIAMLHYQTVPGTDRFIEAHNDYLQLAAEGGVLLGVPVLAALAMFVREVRRRFRDGLDDTRTYWLRAGAVTGLAAMAVQEVVEFTLQMPGAAALFVVLAAIAIHRPAPRATAR